VNIASRILQVRIGNELRKVHVPADPESAMQASWEVHGQKDAYFPFWLEAWPSSYGLYDFLVRNKIPLDGALEIGCGCGVLAQLLQSLPGTILHTDLMPAACAFAARSVEVSQRHFISMDFSKPCLLVPPRLVMGADLFYEYPLVRLICAFVNQGLAPGGEAYFADPDRPSRPDVSQHIAESGVVFTRIPWQYDLNGEAKCLSIWRLRSSSNPPE